MISFKQKGSFDNTVKFFDQVKKAAQVNSLDKYAGDVIRALVAATPKDRGITALSWSYKIERTSKSAKISFYNSSSNDGVSIALLVQYGHAARDGRWIPGIDYVNPAVKPIFDRKRDAAWKEVIKT